MAPAERRGVAWSPRCLAGLLAVGAALSAGAEELAGPRVLGPAASATFPREKLDSCWEKRLRVRGFLCRSGSEREGAPGTPGLSQRSARGAFGGSCRPRGRALGGGRFPPVAPLRAAETLE